MKSLRIAILAACFSIADRALAFDKLSEIAEEIAKAQAAVRHIGVSYRYRLDYESVKARLEDLQAVTISEEVQCAFDGDKTYCDKKIQIANEGKLMPQGTRSSWDGSKTRLVMGSVYYLQQAESNFAFDNIYFAFLCWPKSAMAKTDIERKVGLWLPNALQRNEWRIVSDDGATIVVQNQKGRALHLGAKYRYAVLQGGGIDEKSAKWMCSDFVSVAGGKAYLPRTIKGTTKPAFHGRNPPLVPFELNVTNFSEAKPADELFGFKPSAGMTVSDQINKRHYTFNPVGENTLDEAAAEIARLLPSDKTVAPPTSMWGYVRMASLGLLAVLALYYIGARFLWKKFDA